MSSPHRSLNVHVPLAPLLRLLGCSIETQAHPLKTRCPVCGEGPLLLLQDHVCGGSWHCCRQCGSQGDLITLAARAWSLEPPEAIAHLASCGFDLPADDQAIERYLAEHVAYGERLHTLWAQARKHLLHRGGPHHRAAERWGLLSPEWRYGWEQRSGQLIGYLPKAEVERCFAPGVRQQRSGRRQWSNPSAHRVFPGPDWQDVLAVPFFDLPGRISCFLFIGRDGDPTRDFVVKRANHGWTGNQHVQEPFEAGLAYHPEVFGEADHKDRTIVALGDPLLCVRLQHRHCQTCYRPLPLVSWLDTQAFPD